MKDALQDSLTSYHPEFLPRRVEDLRDRYRPPHYTKEEGGKKLHVIFGQRVLESVFHSQIDEPIGFLRSSILFFAFLYAYCCEVRVGGPVHTHVICVLGSRL